MTERLKGKALSEDVVAPSSRHGENTVFFPVFPLAGFMVEAIGYPFEALGRFHVEKPLPAVGSWRPLRRRKHNVFTLFNAGSGVS